jgi:hydrogenase maturation protease
MSTAPVERIADALLYEGYMLYPYRPSSVKNRQRFNFGVLLPEAWIEGHPGGSERAFLQMECLLLGNGSTTLTVRVRFLQLVERLTIRDVAESWHEAVDRVVQLDCSIGQLLVAPRRNRFTAAAGEQVESLDAEAGTTGIVVRRQQALTGLVEASAEPCGDGVVRLRVLVANRTALPHGDLTRDDALLRSLVSAHAILETQGGEFVSLLDPPEPLAEAAAACQNQGVWPVLAGEDGARNTLLASPIVLYDFPTIAPESAGDLFDGTEIDEILSLRIMSLTDEEKSEVRRSDERARRLLERTESLAEEEMMKLHGALRRPDPLQEERS